jgi:diacylglycerol kinase (ATP)
MQQRWGMALSAFGGSLPPRAVRDGAFVMPALEAPTPDPASRLTKLRIGVLHNPRSGANLTAAALMRRWFAAHPGIPCRDVFDPASVTEALRAMAEHGCNAIAISGGDGTVSAVLGTVFGHSPFARLPLLAVLRGGTANMTARDIGMKGRQDRALRSLLECADRGGDGLIVIERPVMRIDPGAGREPIYGMFFGAAAITQGIEYCKREVHALGLRGEIGPAVTMARFIIAMARGERAIVAPVPITVAIDGGFPSAFDCEIVHVTTLEQLVLGLRPFWGTEAAPLHYASVRSAPRHWVKALPGLLRGRPNRYITPASGYESHNAQQLEIGLDSHFFVDGEMFSPTAGTPLAFTDGGTAGFIQLR